jgi:4-aminobutyrate aminotransferase-like enzyme
MPFGLLQSARPKPASSPGILIGAAGSCGNILKIRPPLCFTKDNADMFIAACDEVLREICPV